MRLIIDKEVDTSDKNLALRFELAWANLDFACIEELVCEDVVFTVAGADRLEGKAALMETFRSTESMILQELVLMGAMYQNPNGSTWGKIQTQSGDKFVYSDHFHFSGDKIDRISVFLVTGTDI